MTSDAKLTLINNSHPEPEPWYKDGLRFKCTECGQCCTGSPGYVWVSEEEIQQIAHHLNVPLKTVMHTYIRQKDGRYSLVEKRTYPHDCVFLKDKKCQIYGARPKQCRTFPWWIHNLKDRESWETAARDCEGITDCAPIVPIETIVANLQAN